ncbi:unnamed protein product [Closterium sp. Yama58-4]|nr:unnamed protein product [Closterium sp. Yama58-4]
MVVKQRGVAARVASSKWRYLFLSSVLLLRLSRPVHPSFPPFRLSRRFHYLHSLMATLSRSFPTSQCQWMKDLMDSVIIHVDGGRSSLLLENMLAEQHDSACQDSERTSSRANESSAADKQPSQWREPSHGNDPGACNFAPFISFRSSLLPGRSFFPDASGVPHLTTPPLDFPCPGSFPLLTYPPASRVCEARQREEPSESNSNKANREKMRRDRLNDRFEELARALKHSKLARADRGSILVDAVRVLVQLRAEMSHLRGSAEHMREQIQELKAEKSELREERARLLASKQQLEDEVRRLAASGAAQSTAATSAATTPVVSSAARPTAAVSPPLGFAPCAPGSPGSPGAVPLMLHAVCDPGKLPPMGERAGAHEQGEQWSILAQLRADVVGAADEGGEGSRRGAEGADARAQGGEE